MRIPLATYRLQFNSRFRFRDALGIVPYLDALGISDLYASPLLQARAGSTHGYDVTDPTRLNRELGSERDFEHLSRELSRRGIGLLLDIVPNHMAASGEMAPMPMMGKYFVYYGSDFIPPRALGRKCVERMVFELYNENSGVCRFHRKWAEAIVDEIISAHYRFAIDYRAHQFALARGIYELDDRASSPWESERIVDAVWRRLEETADQHLRDEELRLWVGRFRADKWQAARAYWDELSTGIAEAFAAGPAALPQP